MPRSSCARIASSVAVASGATLPAAAKSSRCRPSVSVQRHSGRSACAITWRKHSITRCSSTVSITSSGVAARTRVVRSSSSLLQLPCEERQFTGLRCFWLHIVRYTLSARDPRSLLMRVLLSCLLVVLSLPSFAAPRLDQLTLPKGFHIAVYSDQVPDAREIALGADGTVFVGSSGAGKVYALTDRNGDGVADQVRVVARGLRNPIGVAFHDGDLYVSAVSRILVWRDIERHLDAPPKPELVTDKLPGEGHHGGRFLAFGPDGKLYVPIGAPCNICDPGPRYAKLMRMNPDGSDWQDVATGIRNTVGFDWQPGSGRLWFTDNGRDLIDRKSTRLNSSHHSISYAVFCLK